MHSTIPNPTSRKFIIKYWYQRQILLNNIPSSGSISINHHYKSIPHEKYERKISLNAFIISKSKISKTFTRFRRYLAHWCVKSCQNVPGQPIVNKRFFWVQVKSNSANFPRCSRACVEARQNALLRFRDPPIFVGWYHFHKGWAIRFYCWN